MALDWLPIYPARIATVVLLGAAFQPYYASNSYPVPAISQWQAHYPDRLERKGPHASRQSALFQAGRIAIPDAPVPVLAWKAQFPDRIGRKVLPAADRPSYFAVPFSLATQLTQFPSFPDRIDRPKIHASAQGFSFFKLEAIPSFLSWHGEQPVRIVPPGRLLSQQAYFFHPNPVPAPNPPGLGYTTALYPSRIYPKASLITARQQAFAFHSVPIPNPQPPTFLTWLPSYPDALQRPVRASSSAVLVVVLSPAAVPGDLKWQPSYPNFLAQRRPQIGGAVAPIQVGAVLTIAPDLAWAPEYPDQIVRLQASKDFLGFDPLSIASLLPVPPDCVVWWDGDATRAELINQSVTRAGFIDEDVTDSDIVEEKLCD